MKIRFLVSFLMVLTGVCLFIGCENDSDDDGSDNDGGGSSGSYAGVWSGKVCGRNLTMTVNQNGTSLSGSYTLSDPTFTESMQGSVASETPSASATLNGGGNRHFEITFSSFTSFSGGYFKGDTQVCGVSATK